MSYTNCPQESAVIRAVRTGEWSESLEAHLHECAICGGVQEAARWMQALGPATAQEAHERRFRRRKYVTRSPMW